MNTVRRILVVVDNLVESGGVRFVCAQLPPEWKVHFSNSAADALSYLDQVDFDMIFVDLNTGPIDGAQFLHEVWARHPNIIRFLLGSSMDPDLMLTCVMGGHQFLQKPVEASDIHAAVDRAELMNQLLQEKRIQTLVSRIRTFPNRPRVYVEVMKEVHSSDASAQTVGELVSKDLAISTKLLQVINSASFGLANQVTSPAEAVLLLGMETTASLVLGIEAFAHLDNVKRLNFPIEEVWSHSQRVADTARKIAAYITNDSSVAHDAYTAGLLHDIGKVALAINLRDQYHQAMTLALEKDLPISQIETQLLGATHAEAGAYLLALWGLPVEIVKAVAGHHLLPGELEPKFSAVTAVHLANAIENAADVDEFKPETTYPRALELDEHMPGIRELLAFTAEKRSAKIRLLPAAACV